MGRTPVWGFVIALVLASTPWLHGCTGRAPSGGQAETASLTGATAERNCLVRALYFESNRSSRDGLMAVGTVVMNRVASPRFPNTICGVVSQHGQFAAGVMTSPLDPRQVGPAAKAADAILAGERYKPVGNAMHFHMAAFKNPYPAKYVAVAGGNAFYLKPRRLRDVQIASAPTGAIQTPVEAAAFSEPPQQSLVGRLLGGGPALAASSQGAQSCDASQGFGAISLACETDAAGR
ncbi:MAG: cell wall hydrolase [Hyphomicrobiales bacterium]